jgi:hypothetical protein
MPTLVTDGQVYLPSQRVQAADGRENSAPEMEDASPASSCVERAKHFVVIIQHIFHFVALILLVQATEKQLEADEMVTARSC